MSSTRALLKHTKLIFRIVISFLHDEKGRLVTDITKIPDSEFLKFSSMNIYVLFAGFPCQGFSNAGKKLPDDPKIHFSESSQEQLN